MSVKMDDSTAQIKVGQKNWPVEDYVLPANTPATISFTPNSNEYTISNFSVGAPVPIQSGTMTFSQDAKSLDISDDALIMVDPVSSSDVAGAQFKWADVKSGSPQALNVGKYNITAKNGDDSILVSPSQNVSVQNSQNTSIQLNYQKYEGVISFNLTGHYLNV